MTHTETESEPEPRSYPPDRPAAESAAQDTLPTRGLALRTSVLYCLAGGLWILFSDKLLSTFLKNPDTLTQVQTWKGWAFVGFTGLMLYAMLRAQLTRTEKQARLHQHVKASHRTAQAALSESESRFHQLAQSIDEVFWMADVRTKQILFVSQAYEKIWGRTCESLYAAPQSWLDSIHPGDREEVRQAALRGPEGTYDAEYRILRPDGSIRWVHDRGFPVRDGSGVVYRVAGVAQDITDRHKSELAVTERLSLEQRLSKLAATAPGAIISFERLPDGTTRLPYASPRLKEIVGVEPEAVINDAEAGFRLVHTDDLQPLLDAIEASARSMSPCNTVFRVHNPEQGLVWVEANAIPTLEPDGSILWHGFLLNITERQQADTERARLATAVEQAAEAIVITDIAGNIQYVNPAFEKVSGYTRAEVEGSNPRLLKSGGQDEAFYRELWGTLARGDVWRGQLKNKRKDGTLFDEEATISPVHDSTGKIVNYVAVKRDVSHERQVEEQFRQAQKMEAIGRLAGGVAHDFNNLLAVISAHLELLDLQIESPNRQHESVGEIRKAADKAAALTRQLLLFSRRQAVQRRELDLNEVVTHMTKMLRRILGEDIRLRFSYAANALRVHADAGMLDQILLNLAVNARDAMPQGGEMTLETSEVEFPEDIELSMPQARPGPHACLSITDTGCGIAPQNLSRIFEPFFTTKEVGQGTGLGLATVFSIVEQHQGWIQVDSEPGRGSTFQIYLPLLMSAGELDADAGIVAPLRGGNETILFVEDDPSLRAVTQEILEHIGYRVLSAETGREALKVWSQHRDQIRLLLTDLVLPDGMSGLEIARNLTTQNPDLQVIYTSGYSAEIAGKDMALRTRDRFVQKPCSPRVLAGEVRDCLDHKVPEFAC